MGIFFWLIFFYFALGTLYSQLLGHRTLSLRRIFLITMWPIDFSFALMGNILIFLIPKHFASVEELESSTQSEED